MFFKLFPDFALFLADFIDVTCEKHWLWCSGTYRRAQLLTMGLGGVIYTKG